MQITDVPISDLIMAEYNPRKLSPHDERELIASIKKFGFVDPIIANKRKGRENIIVGGHQRLKVAKQLKLKTAPVFYVDLSPADEKELNIRLNKNQGEWDRKALKNWFDEKQLIDWGFKRSETKFFGRKTAEDGFDVGKELRFDNQSQPGDIWDLNDHRIMCGDATKIKDVGDLMGEATADCVFTDPPYNVDYSGGGKDTSNKIENDNLDEEAFRAMLLGSFNNMVQFTRDDAAFYICHSSSSQIEFEQEMNNATIEVKNQIIWNKLVASMGWGDYRWKHEPIFYASKKGVKVPFFGDRAQYTVWDEQWDHKQAKREIQALSEKMSTDGQGSIWKINRDQNYKHPTQKPLQLVEKALANSSSRREIVLDLFIGGGTTLMASEQLDRLAYGMDLDPKYVDVTVRRWVKWMTEQEKKMIIKKNGKKLTKAEIQRILNEW